MKKSIYTKLNEFLNKISIDQSLTEDELFEMSNLYGNNTGLDDIAIWVGSSLKSKHGKRIKVSNLKTKIGSSMDCFTITTPELKVIGRVNKKHITKDKMNKIFEFINLNMQIILDICDEKIDVVEFIQNMKKV